MTLRRKLLSAFGGLVLFTLLLAGMTLHVVSQWQANEKRLGEHYQRSLSLQRIRAATFRAFKEVPDAVTGDDPDSREEFDVYLKSARDDFARWSKLAHTPEEKFEVAEVRASLETLVKDAGRIFTLVEAGDKKAAFTLMEDRLEDQHFARFNSVTQRAVASDQAARKKIRRQNARAQEAARATLLGTAVATLILALLLAAYLATDLFAPLKMVESALKDAAKGDKMVRLDEERSDEIGRINNAFNLLLESQERREKLLSVGGRADVGDGEARSTSIALHTSISQLRGRVAQIKDAPPEQVQRDAPQVLSEIDALLKSVERVADFGIPLDLNLAKIDVRALLYDVMLRFHDQLLQRGVNLEIECDDILQSATFDRLKIREAFAQCVKNSLEALPERGGKIAIRARLDKLDSGNDLVLEVADDGRGDENPVDNALSSRDDPDRRLAEGLQLARAVLEAHGGEIEVQSSPDKGTYVALRMPFRK